MGPVSLGGGGGGYNRRTHLGGTPLSPGEQLTLTLSLTLTLTLTITLTLTLTLTSIGINSNQSEPNWTILPRTEPFSFSFTHMHVLNNFRFESKSIMARTEPFLFSFTCMYRTIFDSNENHSIDCYIFITYITQIDVVMNQRASRNQRASITQL